MRLSPLITSFVKKRKRLFSTGTMSTLSHFLWRCCKTLLADFCSGVFTTQLERPLQGCLRDHITRHRRNFAEK